MIHKHSEEEIVYNSLKYRDRNLENEQCVTMTGGIKILANCYDAHHINRQENKIKIPNQSTNLLKSKITLHTYII